jgi:hypothetical protein
MKQTITLLSLMICAAVSAQLYVSPNPASYVYVGNQYVFVKQDVNLQNTSNLYLRQGGQLLQGTAGTSTNQGQGKLSALQEGTVDNYEYNYWCSPVGNASAAVGNESFGITMLNQPTSATASTAATMLPMASLDGVASPLQIAQRWVFKFLSGATYSNWVSVASASTIAAGEGFTMKGSSGTDNGAFTDNSVTNNPGAAQRYDFRGKPNDGNITVTVGAGKLTLTGNPYPSAIDLQAFLLAATNCTGIAYFWEQDKTVNSHFIAAYQGGYGTYASGTNTYTPPTFYAYNGAGTQLSAVGTGTNFPRKFSPVGQGFMIEGNTNGTVTMANAYRVFQKEGVLSHFERPASQSHSDSATPAGDYYPDIPSVSGFDYTTVSMLPNPQIRFNVLLNNQGIRQMALTFSPLATDAVDRAMDGKSPGGGNADSFFALEGGEYVIAAIDFDINKKVPLGLKSDVAGTFRITVAEMLNFTDADHVYIHDKLDDSYHEILNADYEISLPAGNETSRYEVTFINSSLSVPNIGADAFDVLQDNTAQQLVISNPDLMDLQSCSLYDMTGKLVFSKNGLGTESSYRFSTQGFSEGIYIVKLMTVKGQSFSRKISIFRKNN